MSRLPLTLACTLLTGEVFANLALPSLADSDLAWLGDRIYANECNRVSACLTSWNDGEEFPSLGIGHFIWYQADQEGIYQETFPALLRFLEQEGHDLPGWVLQYGYEQPWPDRASFLAARDGAELSALRTLLEGSLAEQTAFIVQRFNEAIPRLLEAAPAGERQSLEQKILAVASSDLPRGLYALIDYIHFKGEGIRAEERYQGEGWGLLQVLQAMPENAPQPLNAFIAAADATLTRRVANAPAERGEQRWLAGWRNRLETYRPAR